MISLFEKFQPDVIVCCGMTEKWEILTIESQANSGAEVIKTSVDLSNLAIGLDRTEISNDFVKILW